LNESSHIKAIIPVLIGIFSETHWSLILQTVDTNFDTLIAQLNIKL